MTTQPPEHHLPYIGGTIIAGHFNESDSYHISRPQGMGHSLLIYTLGGEGYLRTSAGQRTTREGEFVLLQARVPHQYGTPSGKRWHFLWVHIPDTRKYAYMPEGEITIRPVNSQHTGKRVYRCFRHILHDSREQGTLWQELCENAIQQLLLLMHQDSGKKLDPRVEQTLHLISARMSEPIRIGELASAVYLSESRLSHLFKEETGETIVTAVNRMRIQQAAQYMTHTGRTATQAAIDVGYQNYTHFAASFRQFMGMSPSEYARRSSETPEPEPPSSSQLSARCP